MSNQETNDLIPKVSKIIEELRSSSEEENKFFFDMRKLSKKPIAYFKDVLEDPDETEDSKAVATMLLAYEHSFLEIYAGRRYIETALLECLEDLSQALATLNEKGEGKQ